MLLLDLHFLGLFIGLFLSSLGQIDLELDLLEWTFSCELRLPDNWINLSLLWPLFFAFFHFLSVGLFFLEVATNTFLFFEQLFHFIILASLVLPILILFILSLILGKGLLPAFLLVALTCLFELIEASLLEAFFELSF